MTMGAIIILIYILFWIFLWFPIVTLDNLCGEILSIFWVVMGLCIPVVAKLVM